MLCCIQCPAEGEGRRVRAEVFHQVVVRVHHKASSVATRVLFVVAVWKGWRHATVPACFKTARATSLQVALLMSVTSVLHFFLLLSLLISVPMIRSQNPNIFCVSKDDFYPSRLETAYHPSVDIFLRGSRNTSTHTQAHCGYLASASIISSYRHGYHYE